MQRMAHIRSDSCRRAQPSLQMRHLESGVEVGEFVRNHPFPLDQITGLQVHIAFITHVDGAGRSSQNQDDQDQGEDGGIEQKREPVDSARHAWAMSRSSRRNSPISSRNRAAYSKRSSAAA